MKKLIHFAPTGNRPASQGFWHRCFHLLISIALFSSLASAAWGDGKMFWNSPYAKVITPAQRALITWDNNRETLVIETTLQPPTPETLASGTDLAWVLPLPSVPDKVEKVSPRFLAAFQHFCRPDLITTENLTWQLSLFLFLCSFLLWLMKTMWPESSLLLRFLLLSLLAILLIATTTFSGSSINSIFGNIDGPLSAPVIVHDQREIGSFETATISSPDPLALTAWLETNSFHIPDEIHPAVASYVAEHWIFFAARLKSATTGEMPVPHPLSFTFIATEPIYPLRLTGIDNGTCSMDLYILASGTAETEHFTVTYSQSRDDAIAQQQRLRWRGDVPPSWLQEQYFNKLGIASAEYATICGNSTHITKLSALLSEEQMRNDARIRFVPSIRKIPVVYTHEAALHYSLNWSVPLAALLSLLGMIVPRWRRFIIYGLVSGIIVFAIVQTNLPRGDYKVSINRGLFGDPLPD